MLTQSNVVAPRNDFLDNLVLQAFDCALRTEVDIPVKVHSGKVLWVCSVYHLIDHIEQAINRCIKIQHGNAEHLGYLAELFLVQLDSVIVILRFVILGDCFVCIESLLHDIIDYLLISYQMLLEVDWFNTLWVFRSLGVRRTIIWH